MAHAASADPSSVSAAAPDPDTHQTQDHTAAAAVQTLIDSFVNRIVLIHIPDGRAFRGRFLCVDDGMNVILSDADELRLDERRVEQQQQQDGDQHDGPDDGGQSPPPYSLRWVGMVMIPGEHVLTVQVEETGSGDSHAGTSATKETDHQPSSGTLGAPALDLEYDNMFM